MGASADVEGCADALAAMTGAASAMTNAFAGDVDDLEEVSASLDEDELEEASARLNDYFREECKP